LGIEITIEEDNTVAEEERIEEAFSEENLTYAEHLEDLD
jgi:hypothetical protein